MRYQTIASELRSRIRDGRYGLGASIPVRAELSNEFNVARATLDRSIQLLVEEGLLRSRRGSGTVVARNESLFRVAVIGEDEFLSKFRDPAFDLTLFSAAELTERSERARLGRFEGLIWQLPSADMLEWAREWQGELPQIVVNRNVPDLDFVSTDHRGAIQRLVSSRLAELPDALPVYLAIRGMRPLVDERRQEGFVAACREVQRYHETLHLDSSFEDKIGALERMRSWSEDRPRPLLLVSGCILHTGAVMAWSRRHGLRWRRDVWYSDFDNTYPLDVWGVRVTSFTQDYRGLFCRALEHLKLKLRNREHSARELIEPIFVDGDT